MRSLLVLLCALAMSACATDPKIVAAMIESHRAAQSIPTLTVRCPASCEVSYVDPRDRAQFRAPTNGWDAAIAIAPSVAGIVSATLPAVAVGYVAVRGFDALKGSGAVITRTTSSTTIGPVDNSVRTTTTTTGPNSGPNSGNSTPTTTTTTTQPTTTNKTTTTQKPPPISNAFTITSATVKKQSVKLTLTVAGAGRLAVKATTKYKGKTITFATGGATVNGGAGSLTLKPSSKALAAIKATKKSKKLKVSVTVQYTPTGGATNTKTTSVSIKGLHK